MIGLGMRESSGKFCEGRDKSAKNIKASTAEAGLFQCSFNLNTSHLLLIRLFHYHLAHPSNFISGVFKKNILCKSHNAIHHGNGIGRVFQKLAKENPVFATEFAAIGLRKRMKHWGPIKRKEVEIRRECEVLLRGVEQLIYKHHLNEVLSGRV